MTRQLRRTSGALLLGLVLLTGAAAATPMSDTAVTADAIGPPGGLPDQVPDFVTSILELIQEFLAGGDSPGAGVSDTASGGGA